MCTELLCPLCNVSTFSNIDAFKLNLIKVNSKPIKCPLCSEILLGLDKLTIHLFAHSYAEENIKPLSPYRDEHPQAPPTPPKVNKKTTSMAATKPKQTRLKLMKMTSSSSSSSTAIQQPLTNENFRCEICGFVFVDEQLLNLHLNLVHNCTPSSNSTQTSSQLGGGDHESTPDESKKWNCHLCGKHFKMKGALRIHIRVAHVRFHDQNQRQINIADFLKSQKSSIDLCTLKTELLSLEPYSPDNTQIYAVSSPASIASKSPTHSAALLQQENTLKNPKTFQCDECKKTFTTKYFLKKHKRLHTGEMPYKCHIEGCEKMFHFQQSYHKHLLYHSDAKPYECTECGRSFKELSTLHNHQRIHSGIKPFGCHVCGKFFRQKVSYLVHQRIHNGLLPYKCSECGKGFRYKVSQRSHKCNGALLERQPGDLIQKLMQNSSILHPPPSSTAVSNDHLTKITPSTHAVNNSISNQNENGEIKHERALDLCLDDLLKESYEKLMKVQLSPSQILEDNGFENSIATFENENNNMAINSSYLTTTNNNNNTLDFNSALETINEDSIKELLYGHVG